MTGAWLALIASIAAASAFVAYWRGVGRTEQKYAEDFDATFEAYAAMKHERDQLAAFAHDLIVEAGLMSPTEREAFAHLMNQLEEA